ncbi:MAG: hypothetical protein ACODAU_01265 [Myxococcota bacterium]
MGSDGWLGRLMREDTVRPGLLAVLAAGAAWAALCLVLAADDHAPSVSLVPIPRARYYLAQASFVVPVLLVQWGVCVGVARTVARRLGGAGAVRPLANGLGLALGLPLLSLFVVPDLIAYAVAGFEALGPLVRVTAPLAFVATSVLATGAVRLAHGLGVGRALVAALAGVLAQAVLGGMLLR